MIPSEFAAFVRETGIRAFDSLAGRARKLDKPLQSVLKSWSKLSEDKKNELFDYLIAVARDEDEAPEPPKREKAKKAAPKKKKKKLNV
jgi:hypothetical protein